MIRSYSSVLRSIPVYQAQLNRTDFRSFAPAAGVYSGASPWRPPPPCAGVWAPAAGAAGRFCALDRNARLIIKGPKIATRYHIILSREAIVISSRGCGSLIGGR